MIGSFLTHFADNMRAVPILRDFISSPNAVLSSFDNQQMIKLARESGESVYWSGRNFVKDASGMSLTAPNKGVARTRKIGAGLLAGTMLGSALGIDPMGATSMASDALWGLTHVGIGSAMFRMGGKSRLLGTAYLGLTAYNATQPGNQTGPF